MSYNYDEEEISARDTFARFQKASDEYRAWQQSIKDAATGFGMLYDQPAEDPCPDLTFTVDVKWAAQYTQESDSDEPGAQELEFYLTQAVMEWARRCAPQGTRTSHVIVTN